MPWVLWTWRASFIDVESQTAHVRTRLYFTSESHMHALLNTLRLWRGEVVSGKVVPAQSAKSSGVSFDVHMPGVVCADRRMYPSSAVLVWRFLIIHRSWITCHTWCSGTLVLCCLVF